QLRDGMVAPAEQDGQPAPLPTPVVGHEREARAALPVPAELQRPLLAQRADVEEIPAVGREPHRVLAVEERALADRAGGRRRLHTPPTIGESPANRALRSHFHFFLVLLGLLDDLL